MTAQVIRLRRSAGPCISGTVPGEITAVCGAEPSRPYAAGPRCAAHPPPAKAALHAVLLLEPWQPTAEAAA